MSRDEYGLGTSMGTGRRIAKVCQFMQAGRGGRLRGRLRVSFWLLQDRDDAAADYLGRLLAAHAPHVDASIIDAAGRHVARCIACDICPTHVAVDGEYRCIIKSKKDGFAAWHGELLDQDAVIPVVYSTADRAGLLSNYQTFIERTRYLRRGDYVFSDALTAPLVLEELGAHENMAVRMVTSLIRHHTVVAEPMVAYRHQGTILNQPQIDAQFARFLERAALLTAGRLSCTLDTQAQTACKYNPVGYVLSTEKDKEDERLRTREAMQEDRRARQVQDALLRLEPAALGGRRAG
jgi:multimeric flavodoxin WrbA